MVPVGRVYDVRLPRRSIGTTTGPAPDQRADLLSGRRGQCAGGMTGGSDRREDPGAALPSPAATGGTPRAHTTGPGGRTPPKSTPAGPPAPGDSTGRATFSHLR